MPPSRDPAVSIARGLGITLVVLGHCFDPFNWYPIYSYHMAFFFLLSGYLFNPAHQTDIAGYLRRRARRLLAPYFSYNLLFAGLTLACAAGLGLWTDLKPLSFRALVYEPLTTGHQFPLFNGAWFLVTLFFVQAIFLFLLRLAEDDRPGRMLGFTGTSALVCVLVAKYFDLSPLATQVGKVGFGLFFYTCGFHARRWPGFEAAFTARGLCISGVCAVTLTCLGWETTYNLSTMSFHGNALLVFFTSFSGSYLVYFLARQLAPSVGPRNMLIMFGENTVPIMCLHLFFFFLLKSLIMPFTGMDSTILANTLYCINAPHLYPVYAATGLFGPIATVKIARIAWAYMCRRR